jgi:hypothetical protein
LENGTELIDQEDVRVLLARQIVTAETSRLKLVLSCWIWQYVFPAEQRSPDPRSGLLRRLYVGQREVMAIVTTVVHISAFSEST